MTWLFLRLCMPKSLAAARYAYVFDIPPRRNILRNLHHLFSYNSLRTEANSDQLSCHCRCQCNHDDSLSSGFLKLHSVIGWIFTAIVYTVLLAACCFISYRTTLLFKIVAKKEEDLKTVLDEIQSLSDRLFHSRISTIFHFWKWERIRWTACIHQWTVGGKQQYTSHKNRGEHGQPQWAARMGKCCRRKC